MTQPTVPRDALRELAAAEQRTLAASINMVLDAHVKSAAKKPSRPHRK